MRLSSVTAPSSPSQASPQEDAHAQSCDHISEQPGSLSSSSPCSDSHSSSCSCSSSFSSSSSSSPSSSSSASSSSSSHSSLHPSSSVLSPPAILPSPLRTSLSPGKRRRSPQPCTSPSCSNTSDDTRQVEKNIEPVALSTPALCNNEKLSSTTVDYTLRTPFMSGHQVQPFGKDCDESLPPHRVRDKLTERDLMIRRRRQQELGKARRKRLREAALRRGLRPRRLKFSFDDEPDHADDISDENEQMDVARSQDRDDCSSVLTNLTAELEALNESVSYGRYEQFRRTWNFDPDTGPLPGPWLWQSANREECERASGN